MTESAITPEWVRKHNLTPEQYDKLKAILGRITGASRSAARDNDQMVAGNPTKKLEDEAPVAQHEAREPEHLKAARAFTLAAIPDAPDPAAALKALLAWPIIASKNQGHCPYNTPEEHIALTAGCNAAYLHLDPYEGARIAMAEAARSLACTGAVPLGVAHNLNFGDSHDPEILWQLRESVRGLAEGCRAFNVPIFGDTGGPCHQSPNGLTDPSPTVAMAGLIEEPEHLTAQWFRDEGDAILLLGEFVDAGDPLLGLGGSAYLQRVHGLKTGTLPRCDLEREKELHLVLRALIHSGAIKSAHSCSGGGLAVALAESCLSRQIAREAPRPIGAQIDFSAAANLRLDALLFGETQGRIIISTSALDALKVLARVKLLGVRAERVGTVGGDSLSLKTAAGAFSWPVAELHDLWRNTVYQNQLK